MQYYEMFLWHLWLHLISGFVISNLSVELCFMLLGYLSPRLWQTVLPHLDEHWYTDPILPSKKETFYVFIYPEHV